jgi:chaperonin GroEL
MEDALAATKAAVEEGVVAGGGTALARAAMIVIAQNKKKNIDLSMESKAGYDTLLKAMSEPLRQIAINAGEQDPAVVLNEVKKSKNVNFGYNANKDAFEEDMIKAGIIDPLKVTRTALENAVSVAALLLTTEVAITEEVEEKNTSASSAMAGMGGMM